MYSEVEVAYYTHAHRHQCRNADSPTPLPNQPGGDKSNNSNTPELVFAKPHEEDQPFSTFLDYLIAQEKSKQPYAPPPPPYTTPYPEQQQHHQQQQQRRGQEEEEQEQEQEEEVRYAQTQNDNLRHEYRALLALGHVPRAVGFARVALARDPDAVNLWIGNSRSVTALHRDGYENVYVQLAGRKHFVLLPPLCQPCVNERPLRPAHYERRRSGSGQPSGSGLELVLDDRGEGEGEEGGMMVPFAIWDPDRPHENATRYSGLAQPMRVTLNAGDMLYLPCMWWVDSHNYLKCAFQKRGG